MASATVRAMAAKRAGMRSSVDTADNVSTQPIGWQAHLKVPTVIQPMHNDQPGLSMRAPGLRYSAISKPGLQAADSPATELECDGGRSFAETACCGRLDRVEEGFRRVSQLRTNE